MSKRREGMLRELGEESRRSTLDGVYFFQAVAERSGMNLTDLQCLAVLSSVGPVTAGQLAETMGLTTGAVTGVIKRMERAGYLERGKDPRDGRRVVIRPVPEALERVGSDFFGSQARAMDALASGFDNRDLAVLLEFMRRANAYTREEISRVRAASRGGAGGEFSVPLGSVNSGRLVFANGTSRLTLRTGQEMEDLYRARFEGTSPKVKEEDGTVTVRYPRRFFGLLDWRSQPGEVVLNSAVPWGVELRGGAYQIEADLGGLELSYFGLKGGASECALTLPKPSGAVTVRLYGGVSKASIRRPAGIEARMSLKGSAARLEFDEQSFEAVGGKVRLQSPGYEDASDRYDIEISGGASEISIR